MRPLKVPSFTTGGAEPVGLRPARPKESFADEMSAVLAHELNQPVTALMLYLQAAERLSLQPRFKPALPDTAFEFLEKALHEAERAGHIIQCMRRLVERRAPVRQPGCMNSIVEDALEATLLGAPAGTRVVCDLALDLPLIPIDAVQIQQIIVNLLRNALDAVHDCKAPEICICTRHANGAVMLTVQDNGPGVSAQMASRIFQAFASEKHDGLGLGLMISKVIAHNHGGDLLLESGEKGKGAVFVLRLPVSLPGESPPLAASCAIPQKGAR